MATPGLWKIGIGGGSMKNLRVTLGVLLVAGIGCGASHVPPSTVGPVLKPGEPVTFEIINLAVIQRGNCLDCHSGDRPKGDVNLETFEMILAQEGLIIPGDPEGSLFYQVIESGDMPRRNPRLAPETVALLREWIATGAAP